MTKSVTPLWLRYEGWAGRGIGFLCGAIGVLGFAPLHIWPLGLLSFALLFLRLSHVAQTQPRFKAGLSAGFWHGLGFFGAGIFWVGSAFIARGPAFIPIMPPMVLGLAALLAIFWGIAGGTFVRFYRRGLSSVLLFAAVMTLAELARGHVFGGFPWNLPGYIFEAGSRPSQIASLVNIYGLSWIVLFASAGLGLLLGSGTRLKGAVVIVLPLAALFVHGHMRLNGANIDTVPNVNLRLVSVPFSQADKFDPDKSVAIVNQFMTASVAPGIKDVTHVIWPEGAVNGLAMDNEGLLNAMGRELTVFDDSPPIWIINSLRSVVRPNPRESAEIVDYYNSSVAVSFDGIGTPSIEVNNDKYRLVPFGEFIPGGKWLEGLGVSAFSTSLASISPAPSKTLANFPGLPRLSPQICYEADFPGLTPIDKSNPAQLILNQTNDAWYGKTWGPAQHANIARYRSIEEGIPMVRVASNGLTAVIDSYGRIYSQSVNDEVHQIDSLLPQSIGAIFSTRTLTILNLLINLLTILSYAISGRKLGLRHD